MKRSMLSEFFRGASLFFSFKGMGKEITSSPVENVAPKCEASSTIKGTLYEESSIDEILSGSSKQTRENILRTMSHLDRDQVTKLLSPGYLNCLRKIGDIPEISDLFSLLSSLMVSPKIKNSLLDATTMEAFSKLSADAKRNVFGMLYNKALDEAYCLEVLNPEFFRDLSKETQNIVSALLANKHISMSVQRVILHRPTLVAFDVLPSHEKHEFYVSLAKGIITEERAVNFLLRVS